MTPGVTVTLDGEPAPARGLAGVLVGLSGGRVPAIAHPGDLYLAGHDDETAVLLSDEGLAGRLLRAGFDPGRLAGDAPEPGAFRPLSPAELTAAATFARQPDHRPQRGTILNPGTMAIVQNGSTRTGSPEMMVAHALHGVGPTTSTTSSG